MRYPKRHSEVVRQRLGSLGVETSEHYLSVRYGWLRKLLAREVACEQALKGAAA